MSMSSARKTAALASLASLALLGTGRGFVYDEVRTELASGIETVETNEAVAGSRHHRHYMMNVTVRCTVDPLAKADVSRIFVEPSRFELESDTSMVPLSRLEERVVAYTHLPTKHALSLTVRVECPSGMAAPSPPLGEGGRPTRCESCRISPLVSANHIAGKHMVIADKETSRQIFHPTLGYERWTWLSSLHYMIDGLSIQRATNVFVTHTSHPHGIFQFRSGISEEKGGVIKEETVHVSTGMSLLIHPVMVRVEGGGAPGSAHLSVYCQTEDDGLRILYRTSALPPPSEGGTVCPMVCSGSRVKIVLQAAADARWTPRAFARVRVEWHSVFEYVVRSRLRTRAASLDMLHSVFESDFRSCNPPQVTEPPSEPAASGHHHRHDSSPPWRAARCADREAVQRRRGACRSRLSSVSRGLQERGAAHSFETPTDDFYDFYEVALGEAFALAQPDSPCYEELLGVSCEGRLFETPFLPSGDSYQFNVPFIFCHREMIAPLDVLIDRGISYHSNASCPPSFRAGMVMYNPLAALMQLAVHDVPMTNFVALWDSRDMESGDLQAASAEWLRDACRGYAAETALVAGCRLRNEAPLEGSGGLL